MSERTLQGILTHAKNTKGHLLHSAADEGCPQEESLPDSRAAEGEDLGLAQVNVRWIQRLCKDKLKLPSRKIAKKPLLSQRMKDQQLAFAMEYRDWGVEKWRDVMFSDESNFELHLGDKHGRCRQPVGSD